MTKQVEFLTRPLSCVDESWWTRWDELNTRSLGNHPLLTSDMARLLCAHFGNDALQAVCLHDGRSVAVAQAILHRDGHGRWSVFSPSQAPVDLMVFERADGLDLQPQRLVSGLPGFALALSCPKQDQPFSLLPAGSKLVHGNPWGTTINIDCTSDFDTYWNGRSKELKSNLRRYFKRADEQYPGKWHLTAVRSAEAIGSAVERYGELESQGWKGREGTALNAANAQGRFYRDLLVAFAHRQAAVAFELYFGDQLVASRLAISGPTMHVMLKTTYDEHFGKLAPGRLLLYLALKDLFAGTGAQTVEFYTKANVDMLAWATGTRGIESATVFRNGLVAAAARLKRRFGARSAAAAEVNAG